ncbi:glycosyltransferase family 39 protein [Niabella sp. CC-SYL272]|uniref:ArnT family glycosyltransferase n=1 Tax=Niabella agricola TaxID=2891571 RepID=UPI001F1FDBDA|nr:glycosyltransferase family 39 protein [Niabella agricola]MCF3110004.1 glycosyltransferase family 39 protein [Niabella agricola]
MERFQKKVWYLIAGVVFCKLLLSALLELGNDEVYYLAYAQQWQWNYFDHPPMVALVIRIGSLNLLLKQELLLRLGFIAIGGINTWLVFTIGRKLYSPYAGWIAALLFTASVYAGMISGFMIMPDAPLLLCWLLALSLALDLCCQATRSRQRRLLLLFGLVCGLAAMSKLSGVLLWAGLGSYLLYSRSALLKEPVLYLSLMLTLCIVFPVIYWNMDNGGVGIGYHAGRIAIDHSPVRVDRFLKEVLAEMGYNNPVCCILGISGAVYCSKKRLLPRKQQWLLHSFILPLLLPVWFFSLFRDVLPHWTGPSYVVLSLLGAVLIAHRNKAVRPWPGVLQWANLLTAAVVLLITLASFLLPVTFSSKEALKTGNGDLLLDFTGWHAFAAGFDTLYRKDLATGRMQPAAFILSDYWFPAGHLNWYLAAAYHYPFMAVGSLDEIHQFAWLNLQRAGLKTGSDAYYISVSNYYRAPSGRLLECFKTVADTMVLPQIRMGKVVRYFYITRLRYYKGGIAATGIPDGAG